MAPADAATHEADGVRLDEPDAAAAVRQDQHVTVRGVDGGTGYLRSCPPNPGPDAPCLVEGLDPAAPAAVRAFPARALRPARSDEVRRWTTARRAAGRAARQAGIRDRAGRGVVALEDVRYLLKRLAELAADARARETRGS